MIVATAPRFRVVRPVRYDHDTGKVGWSHTIPPLQMAEVVGELSECEWLVECDHDTQPGSPYTMVISAPGHGEREAPAYLAGPGPIDEQAALLVAAARSHDEDPDDPFETAATWRWLGFPHDELRAWLAADVHSPWRARTLADLGYTPAQAPTIGWFARGETEALADLVAADRAQHPDRQAPAELHTALLSSLRRLPARLPAPAWVDLTGEDEVAVELLLRRLLHPRPAVAHAAAEEITDLLWRPLGMAGRDYHVAARWWQTPLGRACARALGTTQWPPPADADPQALTVREVMDAFGADRAEVERMRASGQLVRTADGRLRPASPIG